jgi:hypothetical protein
LLPTSTMWPFRRRGDVPSGRHRPECIEDEGSDGRLCNESSTSSSGRSVAFSDSASLIDLPAKTSQELGNTWYSEIEYRNHKRECARTIRMMSRKDVMDGDECCERGLENMSEAGKILRRGRHEYCVKLVLEQQTAQRASDSYDDEHFRQVYENATRRSAEIATSRGRQDAEIP